MGNLTSILNGISKSFYNNFIVEDRYMHYVNTATILKGMCREVNVSRDGQATKLHCVLM